MNRAVRITLVTHYFPAHRGGVEAVAWELASRLAANGAAEITWYASDTDPAPNELPGLRCVPGRASNLAERRLGFPYPLWTPAALARLARAARSAEVVHLHDFLYLPNLVAWAAARLSRRPVLVTQHVGMIPYRSRALRMLLAGANRLLGRLVLGRAAQTVFVSESVLEYFRAFVRFRRAPLRLANGVDGSVFLPAQDPARRQERSRLGVAGGMPLLLFAGRFVEKKGLPLLRRIVERLPRAHWVFAGGGPIDPAAWGLANVCVRRGLTSAELVPLYQAADLLVLPSFGEGFPLVVQEAMACGTPALVSEETAAGCPEAAALLLREPLRPEADAAQRWSKRIEALLAAPDALAGLRTRVAAFAAASWSWERCAERYADVLRACARP